MLPLFSLKVKDEPPFPEVHFDFAGTKELIFIYFFKTFEGQSLFIT